MEKKIPVIAVVGPTATGKTALGVALARRFGGEIVSCDSMQVYKGLPIGTAQPSAEELGEIPSHLTACLELNTAFSVSDYVIEAAKIIQAVYVRKRLPILVGGTGLYARSLLRGFDFKENARNDDLRAQLFKQAEECGPDRLYEELKARDPEAAAEIHPNNLKRVIRALEYCQLSGEPFSKQARRSQTAVSPYRSLMLCLAYHDRQKLYERINARVDVMLARGLLEEAKYLHDQLRNGVAPTAAQAIGLKEFFRYFDGEIPLEEAVEDVKRESRRYAKRQITWFSREPEAEFVYADDYSDVQDMVDACSEKVKRFLSEEECP